MTDGYVMAVGLYLLRQCLVCASSSCLEWHQLATTSRGIAACAVGARVLPVHNIQPVPRVRVHATTYNNNNVKNAKTCNKQHRPPANPQHVVWTTSLSTKKIVNKNTRDTQGLLGNATEGPQQHRTTVSRLRRQLATPT